MEYEKIILEMLDRIKVLEEEVTAIKGENEAPKDTFSDNKITVSKKYRRLTDMLINSNSKSVTLTFNEIEKIIGFTLPESSRKHRAFWAHTTTHSIAHGWMAAGYKVLDVNMTAETVVFER